MFLYINEFGINFAARIYYPKHKFVKKEKPVNILGE